MLHQYEAPRPDLYALLSPDNTPYPPHFHTNLELELVLDGFMEISVNGQSARLEPVDLCVIFPNLLHSIPAQIGRKYLLMANPWVLPAFRMLISKNQPISPVLKASEVPDVIQMMLARCVELFRTKDSSLPLSRNHVICIKYSPINRSYIFCRH